MITRLANADKAFISGVFVEGFDVLIEDGLVKAILCKGETAHSDRTIDLGGKTLLPAFWDVHVHFFQTGIRAVEFDAGKYFNRDELFAGIDSWLATHDGINGYGYSPECDGDLPTKNELDKISRVKPVFIRRIDGHSSCANTKAINEFGDTFLSAKGFDFERGRLSLEAQTLADRFMLERVGDKQLNEAAQAVAQEALSRGCGYIGALIPSARWVDVLRRIDLPVRTFMRRETLEPDDAVRSGLSRVGGCMPMVDGAFGSRTALLTEPYADDPAQLGAREISQSELEDWFTRSAEAGLHCAVHAIGDGAVDMILNALHGKESPFVRIEHAELLRDDQIDRIARMGIALAVQPVFESLWGGQTGMYSRRLGERWRMTNRYRDLIDAGVLIAGSSDSYITPIDPPAGIISALKHPNELQAVTLDEAIKMFTINSACAENEQKRFGEIAVGRSADFAILAGDWDAGTIEVSATIVAGEIRFGEI